MPKKPILVAPADAVAALNGIAVKIRKLLDDNGMWVGHLSDGESVWAVVHFTNAVVDPEGSDGPLPFKSGGIAVTIDDDPTVIYQK